jgi:hypothetical protein
MLPFVSTKHRLFLVGSVAGMPASVTNTSFVEPDQCNAERCDAGGICLNSRVADTELARSISNRHDLAPSPEKL